MRLSNTSDVSDMRCFACLTLSRSACRARVASTTAFCASVLAAAATRSAASARVSASAERAFAAATRSRSTCNSAPSVAFFSLSAADSNARLSPSSASPSKCSNAS